MKEETLIKLMFNSTEAQLLELFNQEFSDGVRTNDYWFLRGTLPITLLAHVDTVGGKKDNKRQLMQFRRLLTRENGVLGGDDRAGCMAIWKILRERMRNGLQLPNVILCDGEESGGTGIKRFIADKIYDFADTNLCIEIDRKGCNDYVTYSKDLPKEVSNYVESFGFNSAWGSFSDIGVIINEHSVASVNVSAGFYDNHSKDEYVKLDELELTINRVMAMLDDPIQTRHLMIDKYASTWYKEHNSTTTYEANYRYIYKKGKSGKYELDKVYKPKVVTTYPTMTNFKKFTYQDYPYNPANGRYECKECHQIYASCKCVEPPPQPKQLSLIKPEQNTTDPSIEDGFYQDSDGKWFCLYCDAEKDQCYCKFRGGNAYNYDRLWYW